MTCGASIGRVCMRRGWTGIAEACSVNTLFRSNQAEKLRPSPDSGSDATAISLLRGRSIAHCSAIVLHPQVTEQRSTGENVRTHISHHPLHRIYKYSLHAPVSHFSVPKFSRNIARCRVPDGPRLRPIACEPRQTVVTINARCTTAR